MRGALAARRELWGVLQRVHGAAFGVAAGAAVAARKEEEDDGEDGCGMCGRCELIANSEQSIANSGLVLVRKPVASVRAEGLLEGSTGRVVTMLPRVWAVAEIPAASGLCDPTRVEKAVTNGVRLAGVPASRPRVEVAFYRKYTEAMLRRYVRMATGAGRVPALLGRELFRGNVTHYKVNSFEDVVLFCLDIERCLAKLTNAEKELIKRVAMQEYSQGEAAGVLGLSLRGVVRQYGAALDRLTAMLLEKRLLEPLKSCQ